MTADSYLRQRQSERRWRVLTALVVAGAMAAGAVWTLSRYGEPHPAAAHAGSAPAAGTSLAQNRK